MGLVTRLVRCSRAFGVVRASLYTGHCLRIAQNRGHPEARNESRPLPLRSFWGRIYYKTVCIPVFLSPECSSNVTNSDVIRAHPPFFLLVSSAAKVASFTFSSMCVCVCTHWLRNFHFGFLLQNSPLRFMVSTNRFARQRRYCGFIWDYYCRKLCRQQSI